MSFKKGFPVLVFSFLLVISIFGFFTKQANAASWVERTDAGSRNWSSIASSSDGSKLVASVLDGYIYTSTDSGATWIEQNSSGSRNWSSVASSSDGTKLAAVVNGGYIYTSTDSGATWTERTSAGSRIWSSIASSSDGTKLAAVDSNNPTGGYIYTSTDSGATWTERTGAGAQMWNRIVLSSDGSKLVVTGGDYSFYISVNSGAAWTHSDWSNYVISIASSSDGMKLVAVTSGNQVLTSSDGGINWLNPYMTNQYPTSIASSSDGTKLAMFLEGGYFYTSTNSGATWTEQTGPGLISWTIITSSTSGGRLVAVDNAVETGQSGYIYSYVPDLLPTTTTSVSSSILQTSATLNGNISNRGDEDILVRGFQYGLTTSYGLTTTESGFFGTGNFSANATSLNSNTIYHYRSYVTNSVGTTYGNDLTFTTLSFTNPVISTSTVNSITNTDAFFYSYITDLGGSLLTSYGFQYGLTTSYENTATSNSVVVTNGSLVNSGLFTVSIVSLSKGTVYHFRAFATNTTGTSYNSDQTFTTLSLTTPILTTDDTTLIALNTATLNGTIVNTGGQLNKERGFNYGLTTSYGTTTKLSGTHNVGPYTRNISSLICNTTYHYRAYSKNDLFTGYGDDRIFTTSYCGIPLLDSSTTSLLTQTSVTLNGNVSNTGGNPITNRGFEYGTSISYGTTVNELGSFGVGVFSKNITSLIPDTTYHYRSFATNSSGTAYGNDQTIKTLEMIIIPSVTTSAAVSVVLDSVTLNGNISNTGGENISTRGFEYGTTISYGSITSESGPFGIGDFSTIISSLTPGTTYHFRSYATNSAGKEYGEDLTFAIPAPKFSSHRSSGSTPAVIAQFQAEQKALTEQTPVITTPTTPLSITRTLKYKTTGDDVKVLQNYLNLKGYDCGISDGAFGPKTKRAVILFQTANKLVADGIVGPMTRGKME